MNNVNTSRISPTSSESLPQSSTSKTQGKLEGRRIATQQHYANAQAYTTKASEFLDKGTKIASSAAIMEKVDKLATRIKNGEVSRASGERKLERLKNRVEKMKANKLESYKENLVETFKAENQMRVELLKVLKIASKSLPKDLSKAEKKEKVELQKEKKASLKEKIKSEKEMNRIANDAGNDLMRRIDMNLNKAYSQIDEYLNQAPEKVKKQRKVEVKTSEPTASTAGLPKEILEHNQMASRLSSLKPNLGENTKISEANDNTSAA